jgi:hypothetical protein
MLVPFYDLPPLCAQEGQIIPVARQHCGLKVHSRLFVARDDRLSLRDDRIAELRWRSIQKQHIYGCAAREDSGQQMGQLSLTPMNARPAAAGEHRYVPIAIRACVPPRARTEKVSEHHIRLPF